MRKVLSLLLTIAMVVTSLTVILPAQSFASDTGKVTASDATAQNWDFAAANQGSGVYQYTYNNGTLTNPDTTPLMLNGWPVQPWLAKPATASIFSDYPAADAWINYKVYGTKVEIYAEKAPFGGIAKVTISNESGTEVASQNVDFYDAADTVDTLAYTSPDLTAGVYNVKIAPTGTFNPLNVTNQYWTVNLYKLAVYGGYTPTVGPTAEPTATPSPAPTASPTPSFNPNTEVAPITLTMNKPWDTDANSAKAVDGDQATYFAPEAKYATVVAKLAATTNLKAVKIAFPCASDSEGFAFEIRAFASNPYDGNGNLNIDTMTGKLINQTISKTAGDGFRTYAVSAPGTNYVAVIIKYNTQNSAYWMFGNISDIKVTDTADTDITPESAKGYNFDVTQGKYVESDAAGILDGVTGDNGGGTNWARESVVPEYTLDLGSSKAIDHLSVDWYSSNVQMMTFDVFTSDDNATWSNITGASNNSFLQNKKVTGYQDIYVGKTARYVKIRTYGQDNIGGWGRFCSINEIKVNTVAAGPGPTATTAPSTETRNLYFDEIYQGTSLYRYEFNNGTMTDGDGLPVKLNGQDVQVWQPWKPGNVNMHIFNDRPASDAWLKYKFYGTKVTFRAEVGPNCGIAVVTVTSEGGTVMDTQTVDFYDAIQGPADNSTVKYTSPDLPAGNYTIKVAPTGTMNAASTSTYWTINITYLTVDGAYGNTPTPIPTDTPTPSPTPPITPVPTLDARALPANFTVSMNKPYDGDTAGIASLTDGDTSGNAGTFYAPEAHYAVAVAKLPAATNIKAVNLAFPCQSDNEGFAIEVRTFGSNPYDGNGALNIDSPSAKILNQIVDKSAGDGFKAYSISASNVQYVAIIIKYNTQNSNWWMFGNISDIKVTDTTDNIVIPESAKGYNYDITQMKYVESDAPGLVDGVTGDDGGTTNWARESVVPEYTLDFGLVKPIDRVSVNWYSSNIQQMTYDVYTSNDGTTWTNASDPNFKTSFLVNQKVSGWQDICIGKSARYVKIRTYGQSNIGGWGRFCSINEIKATAEYVAPAVNPSAVTAPITVSLNAPWAGAADISKLTDNDQGTFFAPDAKYAMAVVKLAAVTNLSAVKVAFPCAADNEGFVFEIRAFANNPYDGAGNLNIDTCTGKLINKTIDKSAGNDYQTYALSAPGTQYVAVIVRYNTQMSRWWDFANISDVKVTDTNGTDITPESAKGYNFDTAQGKYVESSAAGVIDGVLGDDGGTVNWARQSVVPEYTIDFGAAKDVDHIAVDWYSSTIQQMTYDVFTSTDGATWANITGAPAVYFLTNQKVAGYQDIYIGQNTRYVKIRTYGQDNAGGWGRFCSINEIKGYVAPPPVTKGSVKISVNGQTVTSAIITTLTVKDAGGNVVAAGTTSATTAAAAIQVDEIAAGTYNVVISRPNCITRTFKDVVITANTVTDLGTGRKLFVGDVSGDGSIDILDVTAVRAITKYKKTCIANAAGDVNGDAIMDILDVTLVRSISNYKKTVADYDKLPVGQ